MRGGGIGESKQRGARMEPGTDNGGGWGGGLSMALLIMYQVPANLHAIWRAK